jgi:predicted methyltransferase
MKTAKLLILSLLLPLSAFAADKEPTATEAKISAAMKHERRTEAEIARDKNRKPLETLNFFGFTDDMTVLELLPGGGWYTKILGPVLEEKGKLYLSLGTRGAVKLLESEPPGFGSTEVIPYDGLKSSESEKFRYTTAEFNFGVRKVDLVLTFRNMHNFDEAGRKNINDAAFKALKKGGHYGVVDHTRRHMQSDNSEVWRRMDPVLIIKEVEAAGFRFVDYSDLHYRPDDELRYEVGRKTVAGNTDRFTLLFEKP